MLRFKQFFGTGADVERKVNDWLAEFEPDVNQMTQTQAEDGAVVLSFLFEESFRGQELRLAMERNMARASAPAMTPSSHPDDPVQVPQEYGIPPVDLR